MAAPQDPESRTYQDYARRVLYVIPSIGLLMVAKVRSWATDPFAAGVWSYYRPGQVTAFATELAKPHQRLFFCGEHTALGSRGMEAALESAERAAVEVQLALG